jgi:hypothetical protein
VYNLENLVHVRHRQAPCSTGSLHSH